MRRFLVFIFVDVVILNFALRSTVGTAFSERSEQCRCAQFEPSQLHANDHCGKPALLKCPVLDARRVSTAASSSPLESQTDTTQSLLRNGLLVFVGEDGGQERIPSGGLCANVRDLITNILFHDY
jgi:hypothetical protein